MPRIFIESLGMEVSASHGVGSGDRVSRHTSCSRKGPVGPGSVLDRLAPSREQSQPQQDMLTLLRGVCDRGCRMDVRTAPLVAAATQEEDEPEAHGSSSRGRHRSRRHGGSTRLEPISVVLLLMVVLASGLIPQGTQGQCSQEGWSSRRRLRDMPAGCCLPRVAAGFHVFQGRSQPRWPALHRQQPPAAPPSAGAVGAIADGGGAGPGPPSRGRTRRGGGGAPAAAAGGGAGGRDQDGRQGPPVAASSSSDARAPEEGGGKPLLLAQAGGSSKRKGWKDAAQGRRLTRAVQSLRDDPEGLLDLLDASLHQLNGVNIAAALKW